MNDDPSISSAIANGASSNTTSINVASSWPAYTNYAPYQLNLNQTGGTLYELTQGALSPINNTIYVGPGLTNDFSLVNAYTWEAGRGYRCDFWRSVAGLVPE